MWETTRLMNPMGDPGCFDSGSVYTLERHFPLRWRRGVAAGDCSRIGRRLFRRECCTCARTRERTSAHTQRKCRRYETLFAETAGSLHVDHTNNLRTGPTHTDARTRRPSRTPHTGHGGRLKSKQASKYRDRSPSRRLATHLPFPRPIQYEDT